jgi:hypothetical protein
MSEKTCEYCKYADKTRNKGGWFSSPKATCMYKTNVWGSRMDYPYGHSCEYFSEGKYLGKCKECSYNDRNPDNPKCSKCSADLYSDRSCSCNKYCYGNEFNQSAE